MKLDRVIALRNNKIIYRDGDRCIKIFSSDYSRSDVLSEALNHSRAEDAGICVPPLLEVTMVDGRWAIVTRFIKGKTLAQLMQEHTEDETRYLTLLSELQKQLHAKTCPMLSRLTDKMRRKMHDAQLPEETKQRLLCRLEHMPVSNHFCHGDFVPSNIVVAQDGTPYILDWSHATQGNAFADAARTYLRFWLDGDVACAETYLDLFSDHQEDYKQSIRSWLPIVAASQSVKERADERQFLLNWVQTADCR